LSDQRSLAILAAGHGAPRLPRCLHAPGGETPLNRTLRALALVGLLGNVIYWVGFA